jgi:hypothetical protein
MRPQALECTRLVLLHEPAVANHIGSHNGCKLALHSNSTRAKTIKPFALQCYAKRQTKASPVRFKSPSSGDVRSMSGLGFESCRQMRRD